MKKIVKNLCLLCFIVIAMQMQSCDNSKERKIEEQDWSEFVSSTSKGFISCASELIVELKDIVPGAVAGETLSSGYFSLSPSVSGDTYWKDQKTIAFRPMKKLESGKEYAIKFHLSKIFKVPTELKIINFTVKTIPQDFSVEGNGFLPYHLSNNKYQMYKGEVNTADFLVGDQLKNFLLADQAKRSLPVSWSSTSDGKTHFFVVDSIIRAEGSGSIMRLKFDGAVLGISTIVDRDVFIPSTAEFKVVDVVLREETDPYISIQCSDPVASDRDLRGIIRFESGDDVRLAVVDSEIKVFPTKPMHGEQRLIIDKSLRSIYNKSLGENVKASVLFSRMTNPEIEILAKGSILPSAGDGLIPFKAVSTKGVSVRIIKIFENNIMQFFQGNRYDGVSDLKKVGRIVYEGDMLFDQTDPKKLSKWNVYGLDISNYVNVEPGAIYNVQLNISPRMSIYPCADDSFNTNDPLTPGSLLFKEDPSDQNIFSWMDNSYNSYNYDGYDWSERKNPCHISYYMNYDRAVSINVLCTDIGVVAKLQSENKLSVTTRNLLSADSEESVNVTVYNFQHQKIGEGRTDSQGKAELMLTGKPFLLVAEKAQQYTYLRMDDASSLPMSVFDVDGVMSQQGILGFMYGERGAWRPGDSLFVSLMIQDTEGIIPEDHPVLFELVDPKGNVVKQQVQQYNKNGLIVYRGATASDDITGRWSLRANLGGITFTKSLRIETVKPNRLKVDLKFDKELFTDKDGEIKGNLFVQWLHGGNAGNLRTDIEMEMLPIKTEFEKYPNYIFDDISKYFNSYTTTIFDSKLDNKGYAMVTKKIDVSKTTPGMLYLKFKMRAFEKSGDFSIAYSGVKYSPYNHYVGVRAPKKDQSLNSLERHKLPIAMVDQSGNPVADDQVEVEVYKVNWYWWWEYRDEVAASRSVSTNSFERILTQIVKIDKGKGEFVLDMKSKFYGRLFIKVKDARGGHSAAAFVNMDYPSWWEDGNIQGGDVAALHFTTDKSEYKVGDKVEVLFPSSKGGKAWITVENHSSILLSEQLSTQDGISKYSYRVTEEMSPNAYVFIHYIQPYSQTKNDRPARMYGVVPVFVKNKEGVLLPKIITEESWEPEKETKITVKEANGKEMSYTLAVVDEGLLDITSFTTPNPWTFFNMRKALGVKTWDMYSNIIGLFSGNYMGLLKPGGDMELEPFASKKSVSRFKPVVKFFGPYHLKSGESQSHTFTMPNYVGAVKLMVVAKNSNAFGAEDKVVKVKKPLMLLSTAPRVLRPGEETDIPINVFVMDPSLKEVDLSLSVNDKLQVIGERTKQLYFNSEGDAVVTFRVKAKEMIGVAEIDVVGKSKNMKATEHIYLPIEPYSGMRSRVEHYEIASGERIEIAYNPYGLEGSREALVEVSGLLPLSLKDNLDFLIKYPHGCLEQIVSGVFPQLFIGNICDLDQEQKDKIKTHVSSVIDRMSKYQTDNGGFSFWPGEYSYVSEWVTNYVGNFMIEARQKGYYIPQNMYVKWLSYQQRSAKHWAGNSFTDSKENSRQMIQAYRLYTLALAGEPAYGDMNRLKELELQPMPRWYLAMSYCLTGNKDVAEKLTEDLHEYCNKYNSPGQTYGSELRDLSISMQALLLMNKQETAYRLLQDMVKRLDRNTFMSTQTTSMVLMGISKFVDGTGGSGKMNLVVQMNGDFAENIQSANPFAQFVPNIKKHPSGRVILENRGDQKLYAKMISKGIPSVHELDYDKQDLNIEVKYSDIQGNVVNPENLKQGTDIYIDVYLKHPGIRATYENMALTQIIPSGWEIRNLRLEEKTDGVSDAFDYQDIRDDRVYTYFSLGKGQVKHFRIIVNAAYTGTYYLPGASCEEMYDPTVYGSVKGQWVNVEK